MAKYTEVRLAVNQAVYDRRTLAHASRFRQAALKSAFEGKFLS
jgi:hypothetical protein